MKIEDIKNMKKCYTHASKFHADDVFGGAFLQIINPNIEIIRVNKLPKNFKGMAFDIGMGEFDHHQKDNECRPNLIPYAAFGKLWRAFAPELYGEFVYKKIDKKIIQDLDLADNTGSYNSLAIAIGALNPIDTTHTDTQYFEALEIAKKILLALINREIVHEKETTKVKKIYESSLDKRIIILNEHLYFQDYLPSTEAIFVIYPSNRGGYCAQGVPINSETVTLKKKFPKQWVDKLPNYLRFCHNSRFLIASDNFEDILYACKEALK